LNKYDQILWCPIFSYGFLPIFPETLETAKRRAAFTAAWLVSFKAWAREEAEHLGSRVK
jgi:hypothetical protein